MKSYFRRTWLDIDTDALRENYEQISSKLTSGARVMAVVKADAYGHGAEQVVKELCKCGCEWFAVSNLEEAMQVKSAAPDSSVLILGYTPPEYAERLAFNGISQAVFNLEYAKALAKNASKNGERKRRRKSRNASTAPSMKSLVRPSSTAASSTTTLQPPRPRRLRWSANS